jgi:hypothetical protein
MESIHREKIEQVIDGLCQKLVWTSAYYRFLKGLHETAKTSPSVLYAHPQLVAYLYHGLFDVLFLKLHHFIDSNKKGRN